MDSELHYGVDSGVGWPSYVDFLSSFIFVLLLLVGALLYLASGDIEEQQIQRAMELGSEHDASQGVANHVEGTKEVISLKRIITFPTGSDDIKRVDRAYLRKVGIVIANRNDCSGLIIQGYADRQPVKSDPKFGNWKLSANRAMRVLQYLYDCGSDCGYTEEQRREVQAKLRLAGEGDTTAQSIPNSLEDRRVDIILECGKGQ